MLRPGKRTIHGRKILDGFPDPDMLAVKLNGSRKPELRQRKRHARREFTLELRDIIRINRCFAMHRESGSRLIPRWSSKQVEAKIVSHDAGQKLRVITRSVPIRPFLLKLGWLHGRPVRNPQRTRGGTLVEHFGNVTSFVKNSHTQNLVFEPGGLTAHEIDCGHNRGLQTCERAYFVCTD